MGNFDTKFGSAKQDWETPQWLFNLLDQEFHFTFDLAASPENAKCSRYFTEEQDALLQKWPAETCWLNPPYGKGNIGKWVGAAAFATLIYGTTTVMLIPVRSNTEWWQKHVMQAAEIRFIRGRPKFGDATHGLPQPLAIVVFRLAGGSPMITRYSSLDARGH